MLFILLAIGSISNSIGKKIFSYQEKQIGFNGQVAYEYALAQVSLGPRIPGSEAHANIIVWINGILKRKGWHVYNQKGLIQGHLINNIIAKNSNTPPEIILATHYDSRMIADNDPLIQNRSLPVPGANDGASGVAILLELSSILLDNENSIWLVFFDAEDNGKTTDWDWIMGSRYFVSKLDSKPKAVLILDMVGDKDLNIFYEMNSDIELLYDIWEKANIIGYSEYFLDKNKYMILDDHIPFIEAGIPAIDIIDFDYPYWHTTQDTIDKISSESLMIVGSTVLYWILSYGKE